MENSADLFCNKSSVDLDLVVFSAFCMSSDDKQLSSVVNDVDIFITEERLDEEILTPTFVSSRA